MCAANWLENPVVMSASDTLPVTVAWSMSLVML